MNSPDRKPDVPQSWEDIQQTGREVERWSILVRLAKGLCADEPRVRAAAFNELADIAAEEKRGRER